MVNLNTDNGLSEGDVINNYWGFTEDAYVEPGTYVWDGNGPNLNGVSLIGKGDPGDVVLDVQGGTTEGSMSGGGGFKNIKLQGANKNSKSGFDLGSGAVMDEFVAHDVAKQLEDRVFYHPDGGQSRSTVKRSAWSGAVNNGAYTDKSPIDFKHCAAWDNNIANIRVGLWKGSDQTQQINIDDCAVGLLGQLDSDAEAGEYSRGIRLRHPGILNITNTLVDWRDIAGAANPVEFHDEAVPGEIHLDHVVIYNETSKAAVRRKTVDAEVYIDGPVIVGGPGNLEVHSVVSGSENLTKDPSMAPPDWDWKAVTYGEQSPVAPYFDDVSGDPTTYDPTTSGGSGGGGSDGGTSDGGGDGGTDTENGSPNLSDKLEAIIRSIANEEATEVVNATIDGVE